MIGIVPENLCSDDAAKEVQKKKKRRSGSLTRKFILYYLIVFFDRIVLLKSGYFQECLLGFVKWSQIVLVINR